MNEAENLAEAQLSFEPVFSVEAFTDRDTDLLYVDTLA
jgi:hypothetical protein